jgi:hypothetical protein
LPSTRLYNKKKIINKNDEPTKAGEEVLFTVEQAA